MTLVNNIKSNILTDIPKTDKKRIVIIGGGFAGMELAKPLLKSDYQIVMLDKNNYHTFQPLLYQVATAGLDPDSVAAPLRENLRSHNFYFRMASVDKVIPESNLVQTNIGLLDYDYLVIATGSKANFFGEETVAEKSFTLKEVGEAFALRNHLFQCLEQAVTVADEVEKEKLLNVVIVGGGPTGIEMAGALSELKKKVIPKEYDTIDTSKINVYLVEGMDSVLNGMSESSRNRTKEYMEELGVKLKLNTLVEKVEGSKIKLSDGTYLQSNTLIWAAGVMGNVIEGINEEHISKSRIEVDRYNKVIGYDNVFALGDVASMKTEEYEKGFPMLAPVAMQQGRHLAKNFKHLLENKPLEKFEYTNKGVMATVGRNKAVVDTPFGWHLSGLPAWLSWMFIHLFFLIGFRQKAVVFANWVYSYFTFKKSTKSIIST
ncbi:NAD(P)/FAD-dependent oxidoreductase [Chondrinema litorale]|uniref:NAD(P)/FAD-dependent oxidoreductase n=1 Tax=Chondrinema litorale TaxID=2994555 RepID=UPI0025439138|nr:NAD(P)/FAD-dependent oxidoreductase [Chondrinema litorale]UZR98189.1 NAD(P)/FAD-dependent oxidoreductase [Chondrinema litorale]